MESGEDGPQGGRYPFPQESSVQCETKTHQRITLRSFQDAEHGVHVAFDGVSKRPTGVSDPVARAKSSASVAVQTPVAQLAIEASDEGILHRLPGRMKSRRTSCAYAHSSMARLTNSPPSSSVIACGARCRSTWLSAAAGRSDLQIIGVFPVIDTEDDLAFHRRIALVRRGLDDERAAVIDHSRPTDRRQLSRTNP